MLLRTSYLIIHQTVAINVVLLRVMTVSIETEDGFGEAHDVIIKHLSHIVVELFGIGAACMHITVRLNSSARDVISCSIK